MIGKHDDRHKATGKCYEIELENEKKGETDPLFLHWVVHKMFIRNLIHFLLRIFGISATIYVALAIHGGRELRQGCFLII